MSHKAAFLRERCEEVLESAKAEGGLLEEESGREPSWAQSPSMLPLEQGLGDLVPFGKSQGANGGAEIQQSGLLWSPFI